MSEFISTLTCCERQRDGVGVYYAHFCGSARMLHFYDGKAEPLTAEVAADPQGEYWAWWDNKRAEFLNIYVGECLVEMCFPYGTKVEEERGNGRKMRVSVNIISPKVVR